MLAAFCPGHWRGKDKWLGRGRVLFDLGDFNDVDDATAFEITRPSLALLWLARFVAALCTFADRPNGAWKMDNGKRDDFVTGLLASGPATCLRPQTDRRSGREESHCATELAQHNAQENCFTSARSDLKALKAFYLFGIVQLWIVRNPRSLPARFLHLALISIRLCGRSVR